MCHEVCFSGDLIKELRLVLGIDGTNGDSVYLSSNEILNLVLLVGYTTRRHNDVDFD